MTNSPALFAVVYAAVAASSACACYGPGTPSKNIMINGFSEKNYAALASNLGNAVCITGRLAIDSKGVYYPLQPVEREGIIDFSFSRINVGLNRNLAFQRGLRNGRIHTICGLLHDATPFKHCEYNDCRWYSLTRAEPRRNGPGLRKHGIRRHNAP